MPTIMKERSDPIEDCQSWFVAIAGSLIGSLLFIPHRLYGLIYVELLDNFNIDRSQASIPLFMNFFIISIAGPLTGFLVKKTSPEIVVIIGCVVCSIGMGANFFAEDILAVIMFLGIFCGTGFSASCMILPNILQKHFTKNFNSSNGIFLAGASFSSFVFSPITVFLFQKYGLSGSLLILSGIMMHSVSAAMLILIVGHNKEKLIIYKKKRQNYEEKGYCVVNEHVMKAFYCQNNDLSKKSSVDESLSISKHTPHIQGRNSLNIVSYTDQKNCLEEKNSNSTEPQIKPLCTSLENLAQVTNDSLIKESHLPSFLKSLSIFLEPSFLIIMFINSSVILFMATTRSTLIDYFRDKGVAVEYEAYILMTQSVFDVVGRLALMWLIDKGYVTAVNFTILGCVIISFTFVSIILSHGIILLIIGASFLELCQGALYTVIPGMVIECLEKEKITMAMPCRQILFAPLSFTTFPLIGYFRNEMNSYDGLYYLLMALSVLCAILTPFSLKFSKNVDKAEK